MSYIDNFINLLNNDLEYSYFIFGCIICFVMPISFIFTKIFDKLLSNKFKLIIEKILIVFGVMIFISAIYCSLFAKKYEIFFWDVFLIIGILIIGWSCFTKIKRLIPDKYFVNQKNLKEFNIYLEQQLLKNNYDLIEELDNIKIYKYKYGKWRDTFFAVMNFEILLEDKFQSNYQILYDYVLENSKSWKYNRIVNLILIVTVNKTNSYFNGYCSDFISDNLRFNILSTGISFGGGKLYIPNTIYIIPTLNKLKKELFKILELNRRRNL